MPHAHAAQQALATDTASLPLRCAQGFSLGQGCAAQVKQALGAHWAYCNYGGKTGEPKRGRNFL